MLVHISFDPSSLKLLKIFSLFSILLKSLCNYNFLLFNIEHIKLSYCIKLLIILYYLL